MRERIALSLIVATVCAIAAPAIAAPVQFGFGGLQSVYAPGGLPYNFTMSVIATQTVGGVENDSGLAIFIPPWSGGDFSLSMAISSVTTDTAHGVGLFAITDTGGDTITGNLVGDWQRNAGHTYMSFVGALSNVVFTDNGSLDGQFDGHIGYLLMDSDPGDGDINAGPLLTSNWFGTTGWTVSSGSVNGSDAPEPVPAPGAMLLALIGIGAIRLRRRHHA